MSSINLSGDMSSVALSLQKIADIGRNPEKVLDAVGRIVLLNTQRRIIQEVDPDGRPFTPLNPMYAAFKKGPGILRGEDFNTGLYGSLSAKATGDVLRWGAGKQYANVHQFGAVIKAKAPGKSLHFFNGPDEVFAKSVTIPARPFLAFTEQDRSETLEALSGFLRRAMTKNS